MPLEVEVRVVEPLGRETLIRAALPMLERDNSVTSIQIQVPANVRLRPGDRISVQLDFNHLFVFDPTTGEALYP